MLVPNGKTPKDNFFRATRNFFNKFVFMKDFIVFWLKYYVLAKISNVQKLNFVRTG